MLATARKKKPENVGIDNDLTANFTHATMTLYKDMTPEKQAELEHEVLDYAKNNKIEDYMKVIKKHNDERLMTTMVKGRFSAVMLFTWHNNLKALQEMEAFAPEWFSNSWWKPMDEVKRAKEMLNTPRILESAKTAAEEILAKYPNTLNDVLHYVNEETKEKVVKLETAMIFIPSTTTLEVAGEVAEEVAGEVAGEPDAKKPKTK